MTQAIKHNADLITAVSNAVDEASARPLAQRGTRLVAGAAVQISGRWVYVADELSHFHIHRPSRVMRGEVDGR
jgi:hypothetical protein